MKSQTKILFGAINPIAEKVFLAELEEYDRKNGIAPRPPRRLEYDDTYSSLPWKNLGDIGIIGPISGFIYLPDYNSEFVQAFGVEADEYLEYKMLDTARILLQSEVQSKLRVDIPKESFRLFGAYL